MTEPFLKTRKVGILEAISRHPKHEGACSGGLRRNAVLTRHALLGVDVDLDEGEAARLGLGRGQLLEDGRDGLAGPAPVGVEVGDDVRVGREDAVPLRLAADVRYLRHGGRRASGCVRT